MTRIGLMLYAVRDGCSRDLEGTLRAVAGMGYEGVELFDLHGHTPEQVRAWLDDARLSACGRHVSLAALEHDLAELAEQAPILGTKRIALRHRALTVKTTVSRPAPMPVEEQPLSKIVPPDLG